MNKVYLSGIVAEQPIRIGSPENPVHAAFRLNVSHRNSKGEWRRELYGVNSWNAAAQWALANLQQGQSVALVGYLTQRVIPVGEKRFTCVEVTSQEFLPLQTRRSLNETTAVQQAAVQPDTHPSDDLTVIDLPDPDVLFPIEPEAA